MKRNISYDVNSFSDGLNTNDSAYQLKNRELADMSNVEINGLGNAYKRGGTSKVNSVTIGTTSYVTTIHQHTDSYGRRIEYCIAGTKLYENVGGTWTEVSDAFGDTKALANNQRASMFTWKDRLYIGNGSDNVFSYGAERIKTDAFFTSSGGSTNRISRITTGGASLGSISSYGGDIDQVGSLEFGCIDRNNGVLYVVDGGTYIKKWSLQGQFLGYIALACYGISWDSINQCLYVCVGTAVHKYDLNLNYVSVAIADTTETALNVTFNGTNFFTVHNNSNLRIYNSSGTLLTTETLTSMTGCIGITSTATKLVVSGQNGYLRQYTIAGLGIDFTVTGLGVLYGVMYYGSKAWVVDTTNSKIKSYNGSGVLVDNLSVACYGFLDYVDDLVIDANCFHDLLTPYQASARLSSPQTTLTANITATDTTIPVTTTLGFPASGSIVIDGETISYASGTSYTLDGCTRGVAGTASVHLKDAKVTSTTITAGTPSGTYKYKFTYVTATGESSGGIESNAITASSQQIRLENISSIGATDVINSYGIPKHVTHWNLYRAYSSDSGVTYGDYKYVGQQVISTSTYDDNIANGSEGETIPTVNGLLPAFKYMIQYNDILIGSGDYNNPNLVYWTNGYNAVSNPKNENDWEVEYFYPIGADDGFAVNGMSMLGNTFIAIKDEHIYGGQFSISSFDWNTDDANGLINLRPYLITEEYGGVSHFTIANATIGGVNGLLWLDKDSGVVFCNGTSVARVSDKIDNGFNALNKTYMKNSYAVYHTDKRQYRFAVTTTGTTNNQVWVFDTQLRQYFKPFTLTACSFARIENSSGLEELWYGNFGGFVFKMDSGNDDAGSAINAYFTTPYYHMNWENHEKIFDRLTVNFIRKGNWNFTVYYSADGGTFTSLGTVAQQDTSLLRDKYTFRLPSLYNKQSIAFKFENTASGEPFEICGLKIDARIHRVNTN